MRPAAWHHPRATRQALLEGRQVAYAFRRSKRRSIGFSVGPEGLVVSAPHGVALEEIDRAVQGKSAWILRKLHETRERHRRLEAARIDWKDGAVLPFLGAPLRLVINAGQRDSRLLPPEGGSVMPALQVGVPVDAAPEQIRQAVKVWLMQQAQVLFTARLNHFAPQLGVHWRRLALSSARTRWGSASVSGAIRLNWQLLHFSAPVIDYVVVHELSHLRVMDHSPRFWGTVASILPNHAWLRRQLRDETAPY